MTAVRSYSGLPSWIPSQRPGSRPFWRVGQRKLTNIQGIGQGVLEYRVDFGPGWRVCFGRDGEVLVILLAGGTKRRQQRDIEDAQTRWTSYKRCKRLAR